MIQRLGLLTDFGSGIVGYISLLVYSDECSEYSYVYLMSGNRMLFGACYVSFYPILPYKSKIGTSSMPYRTNSNTYMVLIQM